MAFDKNCVDLVIYHGGCCDGFGGAFTIWKYYKDNYGSEAANKIEYVADYHCNNRSTDNGFYDKFIGKNVVIVDFSYPEEIILKIIELSKSLIILDHHKTAEKDLKNIPNENKIFDMNRSGAMICWKRASASRRRLLFS